VVTYILYTYLYKIAKILAMMTATANYKMFIKLTNASPQHSGNPVMLQSDSIVSIHEAIVQREGSDVLERVTYIFVPPHGTWEVVETVAEIFTMLEQKN
jgi:hypothetical protein